MFTIKRSLTFLPFALIFLLATTACEKDGNQAPAATQTPGTIFSLRDSIKIESRFQTQDSAFFQRYHGQTYVVSSTNKVRLQTMEMNYNAGTDLAIIFTDSSVSKLYSTFEVVLSNTKHNSLKASYDLTNLSQVRVRSVQIFSDGWVLQMDNFSVLSGDLQMTYDPSRKTVSGEITNLRLPLWFYVSENVTEQTRIANASRIQAGGSTRTVQLKFENIKVQ